jgi:chemotaxis protein histidine kinase CheA
VRVLQNGEPFDQIEADRNGQYFLELPLRGNYILIFEAEGAISKRVQVDGTVLPEDAGLDGFRLELDMALFDYIEGFDESILETPIGIAVFDIDSERIEFDLAHTADMRRRIDKELDRLADAEDDARRNQLRYENAIEDAERAVARSRWDDAKLEYEKALKFIPGDAAAEAGLADVQGKLNAIAAAEAAEQQAELEAQQAEQNQQAEKDRLAAEEAARQDEEARRLAAEQEAEQEAQREAERQAAEQDALDRQEQEAQRVNESQQAGQEERAPQKLETVTDDTDAAIRVEQEALRAKEEERRALKEAKEAERLARQKQAKSRANALSQGSGAGEDPAEAYYRQALESELQARAAGVNDIGKAVKDRNTRLREEEGSRASDSQRQVRSIQETRGDLPASEARRYEGGDGFEAVTASTLRSDAASGIEAIKDSDDSMRKSKKELMDNQARSAMFDLDEVDAYSPLDKKGAVLSPEDADIPQGVHETSYDIQNGLVITRTVRVDDVVTRYRKVVMKTGTYYFCGDKAITKAVWNLETNLSYD